MAEENRTERSCPYCGGTDFETGKVHMVGTTRAIQYTPDGGPALSRWLGFGGRDTQALVCTRCGHLGLFVPRP